MYSFRTVTVLCIAIYRSALVTVKLHLAFQMGCFFLSGQQLVTTSGALVMYMGLLKYKYLLVSGSYSVICVDGHLLVVKHYFSFVYSFSFFPRQWKWYWKSLGL